MTEHEELLMLRALAAKQAQELENKNKIIEKQDAKIRKQNIQIDNMIQALLHARKKLFGPSTEVSKQVDGQLSLFESTQELAEQLNLSKTKIAVKPHERKPRQPGIRQEMLAGLPEEIEEYVIPTDETCGICGGKMKVISKKLVRTEVEYRPAKIVVKHVVQQIAKCMECGKPGSPNEKSNFRKASVPDRDHPAWKTPRPSRPSAAAPPESDNPAYNRTCTAKLPFHARQSHPHSPCSDRDKSIPDSAWKTPRAGQEVLHPYAKEKAPPAL